MTGYRLTLDAIADYIVERIDDEVVNGLSYKGVLPPINTREDYLNFPTSLYPFAGVALKSISYTDESLGKTFPTWRIQVIYSGRDSGIQPDEITDDMLDLTTQIEAILIDTIRGDRFGLPNLVMGGTLVGMSMEPSFYSSVDRNRKAFTIAYFVVDLYFGGV